MKKKNNISDKALELINKKKIKPIPRWEFILKNWVIILGLIICLTLLVLGSSVSWFGLIDNIITPYFWIIITATCFGLSYLLFKKTKRSYRFEKWQIALLILIGGLTIGGMFFKMGIGSRIDRSLESKISLYRQMVPMKMAVWNNPEQGYLSGQITGIDKDNFLLKDFSDKAWIITGTPLIRGRVEIKVGQEIKLIGEKTAENIFVAEEIRPWSGLGRNMMKEN